ncbi:Hypothetical protein D9617_17g046620 [Elsinoe fawcettii]|nr:Hypothetical protein D9617_17g046620 [Elsinoe fawcettii]
MAPPPPPPSRHTKPSPHRFLTKKRSSSAVNTTPSRPNYVAPAAPSLTPRGAPRFTPSAIESTTPSSTQSHKPRFSLGAGVTDKLEADHEDEPPHGTSIYPTTENDQTSALQSHDQPNEEPHKRRRLEEDIYPTDTSPKRPVARFLSQAAVLPASESIGSSKPSFVRSSIPSRTIDPTPEFFSPHRHGQRFVPGAMAAELQSWITDLGTSTSSKSRDVSDYSAVLEVEQVTEDGVLFLDVRTSDGDTVPAMLEGKPGVSVKQGDRLGIRDPSWAMNLDKQRILVGVDWYLIR